MKTIIKILTATVFTSVSVSTVLACGKTRTLQDDVDDIINILETGVEGNSLISGTSKQKDAVVKFQLAAIWINKDAVITLAVASDASKPLVQGDNLIKVIVSLKTITSNAFYANVVGVE